MKNIGRTIDTLIRIDPDFGRKLKIIKSKWKRWPQKTSDYWAELLEYLNTSNLRNHPKREMIRRALNPKKSKKQVLYSFEDVGRNDVIVGPVPEDWADKIRKQDRRYIEIAKLRLEAEMTHNTALMIDLVRKDNILEIETKKMWVDLRDHFDLWAKAGSYNIRNKEGTLFMVASQLNHPQILKPGLIKVTPEIMREFYRFMGYDELPPGLE